MRCLRLRTDSTGRNVRRTAERSKQSRLRKQKARSERRRTLRPVRPYAGVSTHSISPGAGARQRLRKASAGRGGREGCTESVPNFYALFIKNLNCRLLFPFVIPQLLSYNVYDSYLLSMWRLAQIPSLPLSPPDGRQSCFFTEIYAGALFCCLGI